MSTAQDLAYYLERTPTSEEIQEADEWKASNPGVGLNEWVEAMIEIGAL